jgi:hypothetical protein
LFKTVTVTGAEVPLSLDSLVATAVRVAAPFGTSRVFHLKTYGARITGRPSGEPFNMYTTWVTLPSGSVTMARSSTSPETVAPSAGARMVTVGGEWFTT